MTKHSRIPLNSDPQVLILWADNSSPNLGVRALGCGTEALVRRVWPNAQITFQNYGTRSPHLPFGRMRSLVREQVTGRLGMQKWLAGFDLVVDTRSGDSFSDIYGLRRLTIMTTVAACAARAGIPVLLGPQTIGPFTTVRGRLLGKASLRLAHLIMARDTKSAAVAQKLHRSVDVLTTDVVFALDVPTTEKTRDVILNISGLLWNPNPHVDFLHYRRTLTRLQERLMADGRRLTLLAHVLDSPNADNDVPAIKEFTVLTNSSAEVVIPESLEEVRRVASSGQVLIGSRMHACLNALSVGTPSIPLAYSRKFEPLFAGFGWDYSVDLRDPAIDPVAAVLSHLQGAELDIKAAGAVRRARASLSKAQETLEGLS